MDNASAGFKTSSLTHKLEKRLTFAFSCTFADSRMTLTASDLKFSPVEKFKEPRCRTTAFPVTKPLRRLKVQDVLTLTVLPTLGGAVENL